MKHSPGKAMRRALRDLEAYRDKQALTIDSLKHDGASATTIEYEQSALRSLDARIEAARGHLWEHHARRLCH